MKRILSLILCTWIPLSTASFANEPPVLNIASYTTLDHHAPLHEVLPLGNKSTRVKTNSPHQLKLYLATRGIGEPLGTYALPLMASSHIRPTVPGPTSLTDVVERLHSLTQDRTLLEPSLPLLVFVADTISALKPGITPLQANARALLAIHDIQNLNRGLYSTYVISTVLEQIGHQAKSVTSVNVRDEFIAAADLERDIIAAIGVAAGYSFSRGPLEAIVHSHAEGRLKMAVDALNNHSRGRIFLVDLATLAPRGLVRAARDRLEVPLHLQANGRDLSGIPMTNAIHAGKMPVPSVFEIHLLRPGMVEPRKFLLLASTRHADPVGIEHTDGRKPDWEAGKSITPVY